jgi:hypothetical protein
MKPIYFPFTYINKPMAEALGACFRQTVVYQPSRHHVPEEMQAWVDTGLLEIRVPVSGDENNMDAALKEYGTWVSFHQGGAMEYLKRMRDKIPFFDDTFVSQIKADIQRPSSQSRMQKKAEVLVHARLFLQAAQEFDRQQHEINREMKIFEVMESDLIKGLTGEDETSISQAAEPAGLVKDDPGLYMAAERLKAWNYLRQQDPGAAGLYITGSRSVFDELIDRLPEVLPAMRFDTIPVYEKKTEQFMNWQDHLLESLKLLPDVWPAPINGIEEPPMVSRADKVVSLQIYIIPGEFSHNLFTDRIGNGSFQTDAQPEKMKFKNTLIGLIELY